MDANPPTLPLTWRQATLGVLTWGLTLLWLILAWRYTVWFREAEQHFAWHWLAVAAAFALLSALLVLSLFFIPNKKLRYRLAFLGALTIALIQYTIIFLQPILLGQASNTAESTAAAPTSLAFGIPGVIFAAIGAFLGCLVVTGFFESFWEDNSPPPQSVQAAVASIHSQLIGAEFQEPAPKRLFDVCLAGLGLLLSTPVWLFSVFLIWLEDPGPVLFVKNSVSRGGVNFHQYKLRSMVREAEIDTGPVLASEDDQRVLWIGRLLRKTALDELPQLINIMRGEMSFVGPRPQRTVLVYGYLQKMPEYAERHRVRPGLAGLAQVAGDYYLTPRQKLRFDRLYIQNANLGFDLRLLIAAFLITFWYRWQKGWNGRLPRRLLHRN